MQHRHEMTLAAAETAVQIRSLAGVALDRALDDRQRLIETRFELGGDDVIRNRLGRIGDAFGQAQHEVATVHLLGQGDEVFDESVGHNHKSRPAAFTVAEIPNASPSSRSNCPTA